MIDVWKQWRNRWIDRCKAKYPIEKTGTQTIQNLKRVEKYKASGSKKLGIGEIVTESAKVELSKLKGAKFRQEVQMRVLAEMRR